MEETRLPCHSHFLFNNINNVGFYYVSTIIMIDKCLNMNFYFPSYLKWITAAIAVFIFAGCTMNLHPELVTRGVDFPGSKKCGDCHIDIYNEWAGSFHAGSYTSEEFRTSTNNYEYKFCLGCHVPETIFTQLEEEITPREHNLNEGVDCQGCHLTKDCTLSGPHSGMGPHPMEKKEEFYRRSALCGKCHIDTFKEYLTFPDNSGDVTCQSCHMPAIKRKLIQDEPWQKIHIRKEGKMHTFSSSDSIKNNKDFVKMSFTNIMKDPNKLKGILLVENTMNSHSIPTGKYGYKEILLLINIKNSVGNIIRTKQESMFIELGTQLKPKEKRVVPFSFNIDDISSKIYKIEATLSRTDFNRILNILLAKTETMIGK